MRPNAIAFLRNSSCGRIEGGESEGLLLSQLNLILSGYIHLK